jgi:Na+-transporting NADH:ubiquinone oxidoreductase subunit B
MMNRMLVALAPIALVGIYFFGWRVLALLAVSCVAGYATEWIMCSRRGKPVSVACLVTCFLFALSLPPTLPLWQAAVGVVVGVLFAKELFGGFGKNWANPAIVGRAFIYVAFPVEMTGRFVPAFRGWPGGFAHWSFESLAAVPDWLSHGASGIADAVTQATPNIAGRDFHYTVPWTDLVTGRIGGAFESEGVSRVLAAGSIGEVCKPLILLAAIYLLVTRTADWRLMAGPLIGAGLAAAALELTGIGRAGDTVEIFIGGSLLFGAVFMVTEPVSAPRTAAAKWIYGVFIGAMLVLMRTYGQFAGALSFAILLGNIVGPSLDLAVRSVADRGKPAAGPKEASS